MSAREKADGAPAVFPGLPDLVAALPELYQPIYGHPELSQRVARRSEDRLEQVIAVYKALETVLQRPLRVLDLGCAQGYFSHALSELGAKVRGVDFLPANVAVCQALAQERGDGEIVFEVARVEDVLAALAPDEYDLLLGLSVFHHIVQGNGIERTRDMMREISSKVAASVVELALAQEPMEWAFAQPASARDLLVDFPFVHQIASHETHLSPIARPLFFASNRLWFLDGQAGRFHNWTTVSNRLVPQANQGKRRFYFDDDKIVKLCRLDGDKETNKLILDEWKNETALLSDNPARLPLPTLHLSGRSQSEAWLVRDLLPGVTLDRLIAGQAASYDPGRVLADVLAELVALEAVGLYHNDIRTWNVIVLPDGGARLIDYGAVTKRRSDCAWPHNIFFAFLIFMREVLTAAQEFPVPVRSGWLDPSAFPEPYRSAVWRLLQTPVKRWRFRSLAAAWKSARPPDAKAAKAGIPPENAAALLNALETAIAHYRHHIDWLERRLADEHSQRLAVSGELQVERDKTSSLVHDLIAERTARAAAIETHTAERAALNQAIEAERASNAQLRHDLGAARETAAALEQFRHVFETDLESERRANADLRKLNEVLQRDLAAEGERNLALQRDLDGARQAAAALQQLRQVIDADLASQRQANVELQSFNTLLQHDVAVQREARAELEKSLDRERTDRESLQQALDGERQAHTELAEHFAAQEQSLLAEQQARAELAERFAAQEQSLLAEQQTLAIERSARAELEIAFQAESEARTQGRARVITPAPLGVQSVSASRSPDASPTRESILRPGNPKIIHRIYFTDVPPYHDKYEHFLETWRREMPDYTIMQWNETNLDLEANEWVRRAARAKQPVFISEYYRWKKLQEYGGLYLDADCEILSGPILRMLLDELHETDQFDAFLGVEEYNNGFPTAQTVAAKKHSALVDFMVNIYERNLSGPLWHWREERSLIGPQLVSLYFRDNGRDLYGGMFKYIDEPEVEARVKVYPQEWFSPKFGLTGRAINYSTKTCVYHLFSNDNISNMDDESQKMRDRPLLFHEYLEYAKAHPAPVEPPPPPSFLRRAVRFMSKPNRLARLKNKLLGP